MDGKGLRGVAGQRAGRSTCSPHWSTSPPPCQGRRPRHRTDRTTAKTTIKTFCSVTSRAAEQASPAQPTKLIKGHWQVKALHLHRVRDTTFTDDASRHYRALLFVNGWQLGRYINDVGPQHTFPIPPGILRTGGRNTIAIAVWNEDSAGGGLGRVTLQRYANLATSLRASDVPSPGRRTR